jgi:hypothetical protein
MTSPLKGPFSKRLVHSWLKQFAAEDQWVPRRLLKFFRYFDVSAVTELLSALYDELVKDANDMSHTIFVPSGTVASSSNAVLYLFRQVNNIPRGQLLPLSDVPSLALQTRRLVILDDYSGSGHSAERLWAETLASVAAAHPSIEFVFACMVAHHQAIEHLKNTTGFKVVAAEVIPSSHLPFTNDSQIFPSEDERSRATDIITKYSEKISPEGGAFGYASTTSLVAFFFNTPDNTLPIFWASTDDWSPLLRYGAKPEEFEQQIKTGRGSPKSSRRRSAASSLPTALNVYQDHEAAIAILQEFQQTEALTVLGTALQTLMPSGRDLADIFGAARNLRQATHEGSPVHTGLFIVPEGRKAELSARCFIFPEKAISVRDMAAIRTIADFADGITTALVATSGGEVVGCIKYDATFQPGFLPKRLESAAGETLSLGALGFVFAGEHRATLLYEGRQLLTHREGTWQISTPNLRPRLSQISRENGIEETAFLATFELAIELSDIGRGAIFMIGDSERVMALCDQPRVRFGLRTLSTAKENWAAIRSLAVQDGATIISAEGQLLDGRRMLRPTVETTASTGGRAGARHSSAAKTSAVTKAVAVVVSSDGPVSIFVRGELVLQERT